MLLSFSVDYMRPMIVEGLLQCGKPPGYKDTGKRVKRQTIRERGPRANRLLAYGKRPDMALHLWWKSRTKEREFIGSVSKWSVSPITIENQNGALIIECHQMATMTRDEFSLADGFNGLSDFRDYFVPNIGDSFNGILYKW